MLFSNGTPILAYVVAFTFVASRGYGAHALASADRALAFRNTGALSTSTSEAESVSSLWKEAAAQSTQSPPGGSAAAETETLALPTLTARPTSSEKGKRGTIISQCILIHQFSPKVSRGVYLEHGQHKNEASRKSASS